MNSWAGRIPAGAVAARAREVKPGQMLTAAGKAAWPRAIRVGTWITDAIVAVFIAAGCVLGFGVYCIKGVILGFCLAARIPQPGELAARRRAARQEAPPQPPAAKP